MLQSPAFPENISNNPSLTNWGGIGPESRLFVRLMELGSKSVRFSGILPVKRLSDKSTRLRDFIDEMDSGMEEVSLFPCSISMLSFLRFPISEGIMDDRRLWLRSILTRF